MRFSSLFCFIRKPLSWPLVKVVDESGIYESMNKHHKIWPFVPKHFTWMSRKKPIRKLDEQTSDGKVFKTKLKTIFFTPFSSMSYDEWCEDLLLRFARRRLNGWFADFETLSLSRKLLKYEENFVWKIFWQKKLFVGKCFWWMILKR